MSSSVRGACVGRRRGWRTPCILLLGALLDVPSSSAQQESSKELTQFLPETLSNSSQWTPAVLQASGVNGVAQLLRRHGDEELSSNNTHMDLLWYGSVFGVVHVLTGPDHVSAMITLAAGRGMEAFWLGARWGGGHSLGLFIMYIALLAAGEGVFENAGLADKIVGFVMMFLGCVGVVAALRENRNSSAVRLEDDKQDVALQEWKIQAAEQATDVFSHTDPAREPDSRQRADGFDDVALLQEPTKELSLEERTPAGKCAEWLSKSTKEKLLSIFVGIIHGMAGPGGILGVLPAVHQRDVSRGLAYLLAFSVATMMSMGSFAALWGRLTGAAPPGSRIKLVLQVTSGALSIVVGIAWVTLAFMGKLEEVMGL